MSTDKPAQARQQLEPGEQRGYCYAHEGWHVRHATCREWSAQSWPAPVPAPRQSSRIFVQLCISHGSLKQRLRICLPSLDAKGCRGRV